MKAIDNKELIKALEDLEKEKGIKKEYILESIETALVTAYKRNFDAQENVKIEMDKKTGATHVYAVKEIVESPEDSINQISLFKKDENGFKEYIGILKQVEDDYLKIVQENNEYMVQRKNISQVKTVYID